jgi:hypothetical protein
MLAGNRSQLAGSVQVRSAEWVNCSAKGSAPRLRQGSFPGVCELEPTSTEAGSSRASYLQVRPRGRDNSHLRVKVDLAPCVR